MFESEYSQLLNNLSWEKSGQTFVNAVGQLPNIDIAILHLSKLLSQGEQYFFYQKSSSELPEINQDLLKLTVVPPDELPLEEKLIVNHYPKNQADYQFTSYNACLQSNIKSTISILLFARPNFKASLTVHRLQEFDRWQKKEIEAVEILANQGILVISQMLAGKKLQQLAQRETTVNRITATIRSSLEPPVMFAAIAKELGEVMQVDGCTLSLWRQSDQFVKCVGLYNPHEPQAIIQDSLHWQQATTSLVPIAENPILQALIFTKKTVCSNDLEQQKGLARYELPWHAKARALLIVPLIVEEEIIGSITLRQSNSSRDWSQSDVELAEAVANQAAIAIDQGLIHQQMKELAQRETTINRITATIRSSLEPSVMFAAITKELGEALQVDGCTLSLWTPRDHLVKCVGLYNPHEPQAIIKDSSDWQQATSSLVPIAENPILQALIFTKKTVCSSDLEQQKNLARYELPWHAKARALMIVPLIVEAEIIGSITLRQSNGSRNWSPSEIELAETVANQAAIAVQQAKLYKTTKQQAELLQNEEQKVRELNDYLTESVLKRFLPKAIANKAATGQLSLNLSPETRQVTFLFCDLVGFTNLSSHLEVLLLAEILDDFLEVMSKAVFDHDGTVDKFLGDGIMAMFGAPEKLSCHDQAKKAITTARTMHYYLKELNQRWQAQIFKTNSKIPILKMRCGIHQGKAVVGMFGGGQRTDYTAIGKVVNIASRLQSAAAPNSILISEAVANCLGNINLGQERNLQLKGIKRNFKAFTLVME